jgi:mono/diheme cytochrome c family protein
VELEIKEALTMSDIVLSGLNTMSDSKPLQSGGMIFINGKQNSSKARILKPIEISIPRINYNPSMKLFSGEIKKDNGINWKNPESMLNRKERDLTDIGQQLFQTKCATCHSISKNLTGPALAFVTERRCIAWLKKATRNPSKLAQTDICFKAQIKMYGSMMTSFPTLSDPDIEDIYSYITKESEKFLGDEGSPRDYDPCRNLSINDTIEETKVTSTKIGKINKPEEEEITKGGSSGNNIVDTTNKSESRKIPDEYYTFTVNSFGWYNIDCYLEKNKAVTEAQLFVTITGSNEENLFVYFIIPSEKILMSGIKRENGKYSFYKEDGKMPLPQNKTAYILAIKSLSESPLLGKLKFTTSTKHDLTVNVQSLSDIEKEIRSMDLDNFEFEMQHIKTERKLLINERIYEITCPDRGDRGFQKSDTASK